MGKSVNLTQEQERKWIEYEIHLFRKKMFKMNRDLKSYQITGLEVEYSEQMMAPIKLHWQFWKGLFKKKQSNKFESGQKLIKELKKF